MPLLRTHKITISIPNVDTKLGNYILCPKEILQKAYLDKKDSVIDFNGFPAKIIDVQITDDYIFMYLETNNVRLFSNQ